MQNIKEWIKKYEGCKLQAYFDSVGILTIGYGRNLDDVGISQKEANILFDNDYDRCQRELAEYSWYIVQPEDVKAALLNMNFNMGITKLLGFKKMISALIDNDLITAAQEALNSKWAKQVGQRAKDVALMIREAK